MLNLKKNICVYYGKIDQNLLTLVFFLALLVQIPLLFGRYDIIDNIKFFSADEYSLVNVLMRYQGHVTGLDFISLFKESMDYGYGFIFYFSYALFTLPFSAIGGELGVLASGRVLSAIFHSLTIVFIVNYAREFKAESVFLLLFGFVLALTPITLIIQKPLSAEQLAIFLLVWAAIKLLNSNSEEINLIHVAILIGLSLSIKFNGVLEGLFFSVLTLNVLVGRHGFTFIVIRNAGILAGISLITVFLANAPILFSAASRLDYLNWLLLQFNSAGNSQGGSILYTGINDWLNVLRVYSGNIWFTFLLTLSLLPLAMIFYLKNMKMRALSCLAIFLWIAVPTAVCLLIVKKAWVWYLSLPMMFGLMPLVILNGIKPNQSTNKWINGATFPVISYILLIAQFVFVSADYKVLMKNRWDDVVQPNFIEMRNISEVIGVTAKTKKYELIYTDPYTTLPRSKLASESIKIKNKYAFQIELSELLRDKPGLILVNFAGFRRHQNRKKETISEFHSILKQSCNEMLCYREIYRGRTNEIIVYEVTNQ